MWSIHDLQVTIKMSADCPPEPKYMTPGDFLYFQNTCKESSNRNPFSYELKKPILFAEDKRWKVAVVEMKGAWNPDYILCCNIVHESHIGDKEVRMISPLHKHAINQNALTAYYTPLDDECVGVPITEIKFELKYVNMGSVSDVTLSTYGNTEISGLLHFKCEKMIGCNCEQA